MRSGCDMVCFRSSRQSSPGINSVQDERDPLVPRVEIVRIRAIMARSIRLLRQPLPDTFLGRKHHEIIPLPNETDIRNREP